MNHAQHKALLLKAPYETSIITQSAATVGPTDVLLKVHYVGLCGTDLSSYKGMMPLVTYPRIPGHEIAAEIIEKGAAVDAQFQLGDQVTLNPYTSCGTCPACKKGRFNTCATNQTLGVQRDGAMQEYFIAPQTKLYKNNSLPMQQLALAEPLSVGYHASERAEVSAADTVLVIGCGVIGIGAILACVQKGATVIAADIDDQKLSFIKQFGVAYTINTKTEDVLTRVAAITQQNGADVVIEAVGAPATYQLALEAVGFAGRIAAIGYAKEAVALNTSLIVRKELNILGSRNALAEFGPVLQMLEESKYPFQSLISKIYSLEEAGEAFDFWYKHPDQVIKILIKF